jgi:ABC-type phosphate transport system permease subunit
MINTISAIPITSSAKAVRYIQPLKRYAYRKSVNLFMLVLTGLMSLLALVPLFWIIGYVLIKGGHSINLAFLTQTPRPMGTQ